MYNKELVTSFENISLIVHLLVQHVSTVNLLLNI